MERDVSMGVRAASRTGSRPGSSLHMTGTASFVDPPPVEPPSRHKHDLGDSDDSLDDDDMQRVLQASARGRPAPKPGGGGTVASPKRCVCIVLVFVSSDLRRTNSQSSNGNPKITTFLASTCPADAARRNPRHRSPC